MGYALTESATRVDVCNGKPAAQPPVQEVASPEDMTLFRGADDGGRPYAEALIPVAVELIKMGFVGVATKDPEFRELSEDEAVAAVSNIDNWWRYEQWPGAEDALDQLPADRSLTVDVAWQSPFALFHANADRSTLSAWHWPPRMPFIVREV
jgi:hypothetical protein